MDIQRIPAQNFMSYTDCEHFEQEDINCIDKCKWCLWKENNNTCLLNKYPKRIIDCKNYRKPTKKIIMWDVTCSPKVYIEDIIPCQCFISGNNPKEIYKYQKECIYNTLNEYDYEPNVPTELTILPLSEAKKKLHVKKR